MMTGLGGPGSGRMDMMAENPAQMSLAEWMDLLRAGGYGMGPYGYAPAYGIVPWGEQALMLNQQWGLKGFDHGIR